MKSERRHELQENILANYLGRINQSIEPYSRPIGIAVAVLLIGGIGYAIYSSKVSEDRSQATFELLMQQTGSQDPEGLASVSVKYPNTPAAAWAHLYQGSALLAQGTRTLYVNRMDAEDQLNGASKAFRNAIAEGNNELLLSRAYFGIARSEEALGNLDKAIAAYKECVRIGESEEMVNACEERIAALSKESTKDFLTWFKDQDFSPSDPSAPPSLPSGSMLPEMPDLDLPDLGGASDEEPGDGLNLPDDAEMTEEGKEEAKEQASEEAAVTEEPADEKPADEKKAEPKDTPAADDKDAAEEKSPAAEQETELNPPAENTDKAEKEAAVEEVEVDEAAETPEAAEASEADETPAVDEAKTESDAS
ncbi:tetratricopeptide repeat protein [Novipirellula caenicola]|uniref:Tetratricopeptide repeat-like domain-containing protein n=1 Tax=Novipirellula caenicola TaxID=1536901 RepID=A0ABP9VKD9_9BACT